MAGRYPIPDLDGIHRVQVEVRRSRFITSLAHAADVPGARAFIESIKREFPDATHNCWAFAVGAPGDTARVGFSDDGEPHGTAGRPMLHMLLHGGVGEVVCVVTRYFGGVKLGAGGLVRAYQGAVREALESLPTRERLCPARVQAMVEYAHVERLRRLLPLHEAQVEREEFAADASFTLLVPEERAAALAAAIVDASEGRGLAEILPAGAGDTGGGGEGGG